jgi:alginate O-acetyltransferase complex protein AlgI
MLFNSLEFLVFFLAVFALYITVGAKRQNWLLLVASYTFYGAWDYRFLALLAATTLIDYYIALGIENQSSAQTRKRLLVLSMVSNLGVLGFFKYFNFFTDSFVSLLGTFGMTASPFTLEIILPVGISFYTFQSMSYTIDVYRGQLKPSSSLRDFSLYVAFFPQLVAGPIERATTLLPQIVSPRQVTLDKIGSGLVLIVVGLYKKVVMADNLAPIVDGIFSKQQGFTAEEVFVGSLLFAFQIYGDFSGYTDIARGTSRILGFELMPNFKQPYFARNPSDFWRRWHISLSTWLRDYLYISLGGNQGTRLHTYRNLMLTMVLGGLWHGAAWNFVWWGVFHGSLLVGYRIYEDGRQRTGPASAGPVPALRVICETGVMFLFTLYGWLLFRAGSGAQAVELTVGLLNFESAGILAREVTRLLFFAWPVLVLDYFQFRSGRDESILLRAPMATQACAIAGLLLLFIVLGQYEGASFIYFQF